MEIIAVWAIVIILAAAAAAFGAMGASVVFRRKAAAGRVDEYSLSVEEKNGFHFVRLRLLTSDGAAFYELDPNYSHVLSDELLQTSAKALRENHAATG